MDPKIVQQNALLLWNYPNDDYFVGNENNLIVLTPWRMISQAYAWWDPKGTAAKVNEVIAATFREIYKMNDEGKLSTEVYRQERRYFYVWKAEWYLTKFYPADYLADCVMSQKRFCDEQISQAAAMVKQQKEIYPEIGDGHCLNADKRVSRNISDSISQSFYRRGLKPN